MNKLHESQIPMLASNEISAISQLKEDIKRRFNVSRFILFGSRARGDFTEDSDIDLLILVDGPDDFEMKQELWGLAFDSNYKYLTGLSCKLKNVNDWETGEGVFPTFVHNVNKEGIEIEL